MFISLSLSHQIVHRTAVPSALALDWIGKNLYWCDIKRKSLEVSKANGLYPSVLVSTGIRNPTDLALDPQSGYSIRHFDLYPLTSNPTDLALDTQSGHCIRHVDICVYPLTFDSNMYVTAKSRSKVVTILSLLLLIRVFPIKTINLNYQSNFNQM